MKIYARIWFLGAAMIGWAPMAWAQDASQTSAQMAVPADPQSSDTTVVVNGKKKAIVKKLDGTVYNAAGNPKTESGTAQDVLQATPTVSVNANGDISVKGNANVTILINGKPSAAMSPDNRAVALQTMAGSDIASVEVITNPSAAYNANGGAIINIVLRKDRKPGLHGSVRANGSDQGLWNTNVSGDYTKGRLSIHAAGGMRRDATLKYRQSDVDWHDPLSGSFGENDASSEVFVRRLTQNASLGMDYDLSDADSLNASATYNFRHSRPLFDEFHQDRAGGNLADTYDLINVGPNQQSDDSFNLGYSHLKDDAGLKAALQHSDTVNLVDKSAENVFAFPVQAPAYNHVSNRTAHRLDQASLDYGQPFGATGQVSFGLDYQRDQNDIETSFANVDPATGAQTVDTNVSHQYRVVATQGATYVTGQATAGKWEVLAGARLEAMNTRLSAQGQAAIRGVSYLSLDPSLHLKYSFDDQKSVTLSFRQSQERPAPSDLNPFVTYVDPYNLSSGNPGLRPQELKSLELSYDADRDTLSQSLGFFYRKSTDTVVDTQSFTADNILLTTKQNGGSGLSTGISGALSWNPLSGFHLSMDGTVYYIRLNAVDLGGPLRQTGLSYDGNLSLGYASGANDLSLDAHLQGPQIYPQGKASTTRTLNMTWKRHLTKQLDLNISANDILDGSKQTYTTTTSTFYQRGYTHFVVRRVYIGLVYKIG